jgi:hypothetical protein
MRLVMADLIVRTTNDKMRHIPERLGPSLSRRSYLAIRT